MATGNSRTWTEDECQIIREHYPANGAAAVAAMLGRTHLAVMRKAAILGVRCLIANKLRGKGRRQEGSTKHCFRCHEVKSADDFWVRKRSDGSQGRLSYCKTCSKKALSNCDTRSLEQKREVRKKRFLKREYGITLPEYAQMLSKQDGVCAICGLLETRKHRNGVVWALSIDHDHKTNVIRDLLCSNCNALLGHAEDSVSYLKACIAYLDRHADSPSPMGSRARPKTRSPARRAGLL
jgi:hypothetical protein